MISKVFHVIIYVLTHCIFVYMAILVINHLLGCIFLHEPFPLPKFEHKIVNLF